MNDEYPELVKVLLKEKADNFIIDGEIISLNKAGVSDFQLLQHGFSPRWSHGPVTIRRLWRRGFDTWPR